MRDRVLIGVLSLVALGLLVLAVFAPPGSDADEDRARVVDRLFEECVRVQSIENAMYMQYLEMETMNAPEVQTRLGVVTALSSSRSSEIDAYNAWVSLLTDVDAELEEALAARGVPTSLDADEVKTLCVS